MSEQEHTVLVWLLFEQDDSVLVAKRKADGDPFAGHWVLPTRHRARQEAGGTRDAT